MTFTFAIMISNFLLQSVLMLMTIISVVLQNIDSVNKKFWYILTIWTRWFFKNGILCWILENADACPVEEMKKTLSSTVIIKRLQIVWGRFVWNSPYKLYLMSRVFSHPILKLKRLPLIITPVKLRSCKVNVMCSKMHNNMLNKWQHCF